MNVHMPSTAETFIQYVDVAGPSRFAGVGTSSGPVGRFQPSQLMVGGGELAAVDGC